MTAQNCSDRIIEPIELLAPAGDMTCLRAAVKNGADAVYFGLDRGFNARARAENLSLDNLAETMHELHQQGVKGYVTLNTLVFSGELAEFERVVAQIASAGVDAVLIQDLGIVRLVREVCPDLHVHASTQMTMTSAECIAAIECFGVHRVVLARELSLQEIREIASVSRTPVEVFAHGALCVAYSGQCLTSESLGGRSANRGQCAQACRLPYDLICDGHVVDLDRVKYLLSPQDLAAYDYIPNLIEAGVRSLKIEGRLKSPEYVASVTRHYRTAIDHALDGQVFKLRNEDVEEMEMTFSRGFSPGWLEGCDHKRLVPGTSSAKRGIAVGRVMRIRNDGIEVQLNRRMQAGDGVMFDVGLEQNAQPGGRVYQILRDGQRIDGPVQSGRVMLSFRQAMSTLKSVRPGHIVWKTDDPRVTRKLRRALEVDADRRKVPVSVHAVARVGQPLRLNVAIPAATDTVLESDSTLKTATQHPLTQVQLRAQLGRLGNTPFRLDQLTLDVVGQPMVPLSVLGRLRHRMVRCIESKLADSRKIRVARESVLPSLRPPIVPLMAKESPHTGSSIDDSMEGTSVGPPVLHVLCRTVEQLQAVIRTHVTRVSVDFADIRQYAEASSLASRADRSLELWLTTPRIHKPGENGVFLAIKKHAATGWLVRNLAAARFCLEHDLSFAADYSLNVANELSARVIKEMGARRLTPSYDLNREQLVDLLRATPPEWMDVVVHQHMPMFHMEHCVYCAVLSPGTNKTNCGRPCDDHAVHLQDRVGMQHILNADVGCRNTLFNAAPQSGAELVPDLIQSGIRSFRVELLEENASQTMTVVRLYQRLLDGRVSGRKIWTKLNAINRVGVTRGTLEAKRDPLAIL